MSVAINSAAYSNVASGGAGDKLYVPVKPAVLLYSHFDHVSGFKAGKNQNGVSITKIQILNTLIDHLSSIKSGTQESVAHLSTDQIDSMIENYQTQISQAVQAAKTMPYILSGVRPEAGSLFMMDA